MEEAKTWPKSANQVMFPHKRKGAPGFVQRFYSARAAFLTHRVGYACACTCHNRSHKCNLQVYTPVWGEELLVTDKDKRGKLMNGEYQAVQVVPLMVAADSLETVYSKDNFRTTHFVLGVTIHVISLHLPPWTAPNTPMVQFWTQTLVLFGR